MKFALFYEIPVARPWTPGKEHQAYKDTLEQAILGDQMGFHAFWTVEHHFLEEYSHCSNPEVLYGAVAARTENIRIGYGVRLLPAPYNHPIRTAESVAVLDLISDGRVDFGTGRSSTRAGARRASTSIPTRRARCGARRSGTSWAPGPRTSTRPQGEYWQMGAPRRVLPEAAAAAAPADLRRDQQPARSRGDRSARHRALLVHRRPPARAARRQHRDVPQGSRRVRRSPRASSSTTPRPRSRWCCARRRTKRPPRSRASRSSGTRSTAAGSSRRSPSGRRSAASPATTLGTYQYTGDALKLQA